MPLYLYLYLYLCLHLSTSTVIRICISTWPKVKSQSPAKSKLDKSRPPDKSWPYSYSGRQIDNGAAVALLPLCGTGSRCCSGLSRDLAGKNI